MRASRQNHSCAVRQVAVSAVALTVLCGLIGAETFAVHAQDAGQVSAQDPVLPLESEPAAAPSPALPLPPAGPLKVLSWYVASSPYAIAMRKIKTTAPSWRTSFGSERRTIEAPPPPQAAFIDADVVLLQGITNPRALRRLFPARRWRLVFSRRALASLPKGSVFTAPVSSVEVEAVAIRFRDGMRITNRAEEIDDAPTSQPVTAVSNASPAQPANASPGLAVKVVDHGRTLWFASVTLDHPCATPAANCDAAMLLQRWQKARHDGGEDVVTGGRLREESDTSPCSGQAIEVGTSEAKALQQQAKGENRAVLGCVAELILQ